MTAEAYIQLMCIHEVVSQCNQQVPTYNPIVKNTALKNSDKADLLDLISRVSRRWPWLESTLPARNRPFWDFVWPQVL